MSDSPPKDDPLGDAWIAFRDAHLAALDGIERMVQASRAYAAVYAERTHTQSGIQFDITDLPVVTDSDVSGGGPVREPAAATSLTAEQEFSGECVKQASIGDYVRCRVEGCIDGTIVGLHANFVEMKDGSWVCCEHYEGAQTVAKGR